MNIENSFFSLLILVGGIFTFVGIITAIFPPSKINYLYGYRTTSSMKTQDRWDFSQKFSSKLLIFSGLFLAFISTLGLFFSISESIDFGMGMATILVTVLFLFLKTESAIKKQFP